MTTRLKRLAGRIVLVQEDRFRMVGTTGKGYLFTLSHKARTSSEDLRRWRRANLNVVVHYDGEPNLDSGVIYRVKPGSSL